MANTNLRNKGSNMWMGDPIEYNNWPYGALTEDPGNFVICNLAGSKVEVKALEHEVCYKIKACKTTHKGYEYMEAGITGWIWYDQSSNCDGQKWKVSILDGDYSFENIGYPGKYLGYDDSEEEHKWLCLKDTPDLWEIKKETEVK